MLTNDQLRGIYPLIVTPSHDGKFFYNYTLSLLNLQNVSMQLGMPIQFLLQQGESLVTRARNNCVAQFLENPDWTHLFWIDSDIGFTLMRLCVCCAPITILPQVCIRSNTKLGLSKVCHKA